MPTLVFNPIPKYIADLPGTAHGSECVCAGFLVLKEFL